MPKTKKKKEIDNKALIKMVNDKATKKEIIERFGIKTYAQVDKAYLDALVQEKIVTGITSGRGSSKKTVSNKIKLNKRGSLIISKALADSLDITAKDTFEVKKSKAGISLKKKEST